MSQKNPVSLLDALPIHVQRALRSSKHTVKYAPNKTILRQDEISNDVYFINYGKVRINLFTQRGYRLSFTESYSGQSFGEISAIDMQPRSANVIAIEETSLTCIPHATFIELLGAHPHFSMFVLKQLSTVVRRLNGRICELSALDSTHRIYAELIRIAEAGELKDGEIVVNNPPTHVEIASRVASHREAVSRVYNNLKREGLLDKRSRKLLLRNLDVLEKRIVDKLNK